jgi:hypothetical protein
MSERGRVPIEAVAYTDPDEPAVFRLPTGWRLGEHFRPWLSAITKHPEGVEPSGIPIAKIDSIKWAYGPVDLDGHNGISLMCWADLQLEGTTQQIEEAFDHNIAKRFEIQLVVPGTNHPINPAVYTCLISPEVALFRRRINY